VVQAYIATMLSILHSFTFHSCADSYGSPRPVEPRSTVYQPTGDPIRRRFAFREMSPTS